MHEQHEVQRKLGRCLLRLQQYELLLKTIAAHQVVEGPADQLQDIRDGQAAELKNKTLGQVVATFRETFLSIEPSRTTGSRHEGPPAGELKTAWMRLHTTIATDADAHAETTRQLRELVALRNELVHHFIEKFNVWTLDGCREASAYLDAAYGTIDSHLLALHDLQKNMQEAYAVTAAFLASKEWEDIFVHGIEPDGAVDWSRATIVQLLRKAATPARSLDGWTNLAAAIAFVGATDGEHTPKRYGCSSWRQVLHESKQFDVRRDKPSAIESRATWYRVRGASTSH